MAIPGMTSYAQVEENLGARGKRFALADKIALARYALEIGDRHCGLCGACGGVCPNGVEVPNVLRALTYLEGYREEDLARSAYGSLPPGRNAAACGECEACLVACRLRLPVGRLARRALKVDVIDILQLHGISTEGEVTDERASRRFGS